MKIITFRSALLLGFFLVLFTQTTFAQWVKQTLPTVQLDHGFPRTVGKDVMWTFSVLYVPDSARANLPVEYSVTSDGGKTYQKGIIGNYSEYFSNIYPLDGKTAFFTLNHPTDPTLNEIKKTEDGGRTWQTLSYKPTTFASAIHFYDANNILFMGDSDDKGMVIQHSIDGGKSFVRTPNSALPNQVEGEVVSDVGISGNNVYTLSFNPDHTQWRTWRSADRGKTWLASSTWNNVADFNPILVAFTDAQNGMVTPFIVSPLDYTMYTEDGGLTWHKGGKIPGVQTYPLVHIPGTSSMMALFGDIQRGKLFSALTNDLGRTWNTFKDVAPYTIDSIYGPDFAFNFANLEVNDNYSGWSRFSRKDFYHYDNPTPHVPEQPDLEITLKADNDGLPLYGSVKYTLTLTNRGISPATGIRINWLPPYKRTNNGVGPYAYQAAYSDKGRYDSWNGVWTLDKLDAGAIATATFHLFVLDNTKDVSQTAQVIATNEKDLDSSPNNMVGAAKEDDEIGYVAKAKNSTAEMPNDAFKAKLPEFAVSPNPAKDKIYVAINPATEGEWSIRIMNNIGQVVFNQNGQYNNRVEVDAKSFENGLYLVEYQAQGERRIEKVIVQH